MASALSTRIEKSYRIVPIEGSTLVFGAGLPSPNYPPANVSAWVKICRDVGREDLAQAILTQWNTIYENALIKYPAVRTNWAAASKIGAASIKKNVFKHDEFPVWLEKNQKLTGHQKQDLSQAKIPDVPPGTPKIAIPTDTETPDEWLAAAAKTSEMLANAEKAFVNADELVAFLEKEIAEISNKIIKYSGPKAKTKSGEPSAYAARIPKWQEQLKLYQAKLHETKKKIANAEQNLKSGKDAYNTAPITTVAYEQTVQEKIITLTKRLSEIDKHRQEIVTELQSLVAQLGSPRVEAAHKVEADLTNIFGRLIDLFRKIWTSVSGWGNDVLEASHDFLDLATMRNIK